jgi:hypothetical protein
MRAGGIERVVDLALERRDSLRLSADQVKKLQDFKTDLGKQRDELREQMDKARKDSNGDRDKMREEMQDFREKMQKSRDDQRKKFEGILSDAQRKQLQAMMPRDGGRQGGRRRQAGRAGFQRGAMRAPGAPGFGPGARGFGRGQAFQGAPGLGARGFGGPGFAGPGMAPGAGNPMAAYRQGWLDAMRALRDGRAAQDGPPPPPPATGGRR